jgi:magnesium-protoporphyrin IX monomethyl ester (oxidative) cyclase
MNPKTRFIQDLDELPFPARDLVPYDKYHEVSEAHGPTQRKWTPILSSRGCPFHCTFCTPGLWGHRYRVRSAANVLDEIEECVTRYGIREFHFEDEKLTIHKKRVMEVCKGIRDRNLAIQWQTPNGIRASVTDREILSAMRDSGCHHVTVAPESGSPRVLNEIIKKQQDLSRVTDAVRHASKLGMRTAAYFVLGLPGETVREVNQSISYASQLARIGLDEVVFSNYVALPGSELYKMLVREGRIDGDWQNLVSMGDLARASSWSEHISSEDLSALRRKAYLTFHLTKALFHPLKIIRSILNVLRKREELKTERVLITFIKRLGLRKRKPSPCSRDIFETGFKDSTDKDTATLPGRVHFMPTQAATPGFNQFIRR